MARTWLQFLVSFAFSAISAVIVFTVSASAADWPQWLGPARDGSTPEIVQPWTQPLKVRWSIKVGEGHSSPVVLGNMVILHTASSDQVDDEPDVRARTEYVTAYDINTCDVKWVGRMSKRPFQSQFGNGPRATPVVADGKVFCFGVTGTFAVFDLASGKLLTNEVDLVEEHKAKVPFFGVSSSPVVDGGNIFLMVGGPEAGLVAIDTKTYKLTGKWLKDAASYSAPIAVGTGDQRQIVALTADGLNGIVPANSEPAWRFRFKDLLSESSATPIVAGDVLIGSSVTLGSIGLKMISKNGRPGVEEAWRNSALTCYFSTPVAVGPHVYMVTGRLPLPGRPPTATLHCVEAATGKVLWSKPNVGTYGATLARTGDNKLLLLEEPGHLVLIQPDPVEYKELARDKICDETWAHFAVANGKLFVRDRKELKCLELPIGR
jgi:outer membrane protein assembly factor BamB